MTQQSCSTELSQKYICCPASPALNLYTGRASGIKLPLALPSAELIPRINKEPQNSKAERPYERRPCLTGRCRAQPLRLNLWSSRASARIALRLFTEPRPRRPRVIVPGRLPRSVAWSDLALSSEGLSCSQAPRFDGASQPSICMAVWAALKRRTTAMQTGTPLETVPPRAHIIYFAAIALL